MDLAPNPLVAARVLDRPADHLQAVFHLLGRACRLAVELEGELGEVPHHEVKDLVDEIVVDAVEVSRSRG